MKIMYLLFSFTVGGTEKLLTDICNEMSNENEVYLYIVNDHIDESIISKVLPKVHIFKYGRKVASKNHLKTIIDIYRFCKNMDIDIVHCNALNAPELMLLTKIFCNKLKIVYTIHDVGQYKMLNKLRIWYRNVICDSIIAISQSVYDDIVSYGCNKKKTQIVYNAIDLSQFTNFEHIEKNLEPFVIGNVARIDISKKGQDILLDAVLMLKNKEKINCIFAGAPDSKHEIELAELKNRALEETEGTNCKISFIGTISDVPNFLRKINLFILPSRFEGFGISLIEAMAMGIPCISSNINGPKEIIGDNERGLLFETDSSSDLAEKILYVMRNYDAALKKAEKAKLYVDSNFNIKDMCDHLLSIYRQ